MVEDYVVIIQSKLSKSMISSENNFDVSGTAMKQNQLTAPLQVESHILSSLRNRHAAQFRRTLEC